MTCACDWLDIIIATLLIVSIPLWIIFSVYAFIQLGERCDGND